jgi:hypothetical protein
MRRFALITLLSLSVLPGIAVAQEVSNPPMAGANGQPMNHMGQHGAWRHHGHHMNPVEFVEKFYAANTTHDGHLTLAQAKTAKLKFVADHFTQIDTKNHGYVTLYDIQAWRLDSIAQRLEHRADKLRAKD